MSGHRTWQDLRDELLTTPEARAAYDRHRVEMDGAWDVVCRHGCCVWWISQDSNRREELGGWGPAACPCACNDIEYWGPVV